MVLAATLAHCIVAGSTRGSIKLRPVEDAGMFRARVRALLVLVAVCALALGPGRSLSLSLHYWLKARDHERVVLESLHEEAKLDKAARDRCGDWICNFALLLVAPEFAPRLEPDGKRPVRMAQRRAKLIRRIDYHHALSVKYRAAVDQPLLAIEPDPPESSAP